MMGFKFTIVSLVAITFSSRTCDSLNRNSSVNFLQTKIKPFITSCDPDLECMMSGAEGSLVQDPADCHKYYVCVRVDEQIRASDASITCPTGQYFNTDSSACENEDQPCINSCDTRCSLVCTEELDVVPYPGSCSQYEVCLIGGDTQVESCPPERPYFNGADCTTDSSSCCDVCSINCVEIGVQIPDPCDCHNYYICITLGIPSEDTHESCPNDGHFNPTLGECVSGNGCTQLCSSDSCGNSPPPQTTTQAYSTPEKSTTPEIETSTPPTTTRSPYTLTASPPETTTTPPPETTTAPPAETTIATPAETTTTPPAETTTAPPAETTTAPPAETTTSMHSSNPSCLTTLYCERTGEFAMCNDCINSYFLCSTVGSQASLADCPDEEFFNPNPNYPFCLPPEDCPYPSL